MAIQNNEQEEKVFIDPLAAGLEEGEAVELDTNADAFEVSCPPPAGRYDLHVTEAKDCYEQATTEQGQVFYKANLECRIVNSGTDADGTVVFARVSTFVARGKKISTMAYVLLKLGYPADKLAGPITPIQLVQKFAKWIRKADRIAKGCLLDWQGWSKNLEKVVFNKMADFPPTRDGGHQHIVDYRKVGSPSEEIVARLKLKDWGAAQGTAAPKVGASAAGGTKTAPVVKKAAPAAPVASDDDEEAPAPTPTPKKVSAKAVAATPSAKEVDALLDGDDD